jgi:hypothetical protein
MPPQMAPTAQIGMPLTDDGDVTQVLVPCNILEHLETLGNRQIDLGQDDVYLAALAVENIDHLPRRLGASYWIKKRKKKLPRS